jgi:predicted N-acetyltransferase YhbS
MAGRNGAGVEERLQRVSLYEPSLDLSVETDAGEPAGYALFWADPMTGVGMLEPMRVEDAHQRRGLARAMLTEGLERLALRGSVRLKVGFDGPAGEALYLGAGFVVDNMVRSHVRAAGR